MIFEALAERFAACGGFDYDEAEQMDETGAPWVSTDNRLGISLNEGGSRDIELILPDEKFDGKPWGWQISERGKVLADGHIEMTWQQWNNLGDGPNSGPYRIGGKPAGELESQLMDAVALAE